LKIAKNTGIVIFVTILNKHIWVWLLTGHII